MLLKELIKQGTDIISVLYPEREAREMVFAFLEHSIGTKRHTHIVEPDYSVSESVVEHAFSAFRRMAEGEPLQYVTGVAEFYGRQFRVTPDVLIPRPETEILCRIAVENMPEKATILDLCTGSGCIAWTLALECPGTRVSAVDISGNALEVASAQDFTRELNCAGASAPDFFRADVLEDVAEEFIGKKYDILVSNPPYVMESEKPLMRANVLDHEPHLALFVPDRDPLRFYRAVCRWCVELLAPRGIGIVEINEALSEETARIFSDAGFHSVSVVSDLSERPRFVTFRR